ncbi:hypothetical protein WIW89_05885 [Stygiolobus sp. CP850M]|uniref:hypothetical protein n=1 Tax=Stygiolobus sp. CP850M TaxID=3133134 RepID=UPI00307CF732
MYNWARLMFIRDKVVSGDVISEPEPVFEGYLINDSFLIAGDGVVDVLSELSIHSVMKEGPKVDRGVNVEELVNKYGLLREELVPKKDLVQLDDDEYVENYL